MSASKESRLKNALLGAGVAWTLSALLFTVVWWLNHQMIVLPPVAVPATMLAIVGIGFVSSLTAGRFADVWLICASAAVAYWLVYRIHFALYPNWPESEDGIWGTTLLVGLYLVPFIIAGYVLALAYRRARRRAV